MPFAIPDGVPKILVPPSGSPKPTDPNKTCDKTGRKDKCFDVPGSCTNCAYKVCSGPNTLPIQMICGDTDSCEVRNGVGVCKGYIP